MGVVLYKEFCSFFSMLLWLSWLASVFMFLWGYASGDITWPENTEATVGSDVVFHCASSSERPSEWHHVPVGSSRPEISHKDGSCLNGYCERGYSIVSNAPGEYSLHIHNVNTDDAGTHRCVLTNEQRGAELIVIDIYPGNDTCFAQIPKDGAIGHNQCQLEPDLITLSCSLRYFGNVKAFPEWTQTSANHIDFKIASKTLDDITTATLTLEHDRLQEATFLCSIRHQNLNLTSPLNCILRIKSVPLRQRNETVDSDLQLIDCGSELPYNCSYRWRHKNNEISVSQRLNLTGRTNGAYLCYANCDVRGRWCSFLAQEISYQHLESASSEASNIGFIVGIVFAVVVAIVIIVNGFVILFIFRKRKMARVSITFANGVPKKDENEDSPAETFIKMPRQDPQKDEEIDKLFDGNGDEEESDGGRIFNFDDQTEAHISNITSASSGCNIKLRPTDCTAESGNTAGHDEATNRNMDESVV